MSKFDSLKPYNKICIDPNNSLLIPADWSWNCLEENMIIAIDFAEDLFIHQVMIQQLKDWYILYDH